MDRSGCATSAADSGAAPKAPSPESVVPSGGYRLQRPLARAPDMTAERFGRVGMTADRRRNAAEGVPPTTNRRAQSADLTPASLNQILYHNG